MRILVLDDNQDILDIVAEVLLYEGYKVKTTGRAAAFKNLLQDWQPHVVILDFMLADGNGGELCQDMKKNSHKTYSGDLIFRLF